MILTVDRFALTTNNITYAAFGDAMNYWSFFPTGQEGWGHMPVWGFATVTDSRVPGVDPGERFYGYFPIATALKVRPERISERGFYDATDYRQGLPSPYNQYTRCSTDGAYVKALEEYQMLLRPLFFTSYMLADFLSDNEFFGARQLVVSSASSKTAYGAAFALREMGDPVRIALTSPSNRDYVEGLGLYQQVVDYDQLASLDAGQPTLYVDFSGDEALRHAVHDHFGPALVYDCYAGSATNTEFLKADATLTPEPRFFFAPVQIRKRNQDWGPAVLSERFGAAQRRFLQAVSDPVSGWMSLCEHRGGQGGGAGDPCIERSRRIAPGRTRGAFAVADWLSSGAMPRKKDRRP
ncbi:hypothetical protein Q668_06045 [Alcanivorax sp. PN-3]|nr:hypothetical protein Q668_06045 [Alcanivorax sp. PN-3]